MNEQLSTDNLQANLNDADRELYEQFLVENQLFYGPDPEMMADHSLSARTAAEERVLESDLDMQRVNLVRGRLDSALQESFTMVEQMGVAPGAKWGDLVTGIFTAEGDLSQVAGGVGSETEST